MYCKTTHTWLGGEGFPGAVGVLEGGAMVMINFHVELGACKMSHLHNFYAICNGTSCGKRPSSLTGTITKGVENCVDETFCKVLAWAALKIWTGGPQKPNASGMWNLWCQQPESKLFEWMDFDPIRWNLELWISFGNFPTKFPETKWISFWKSEKKLENIKWCKFQKNSCILITFCSHFLNIYLEMTNFILISKYTRPLMRD